MRRITPLVPLVPESVLESVIDVVGIGVRIRRNDAVQFQPVPVWLPGIATSRPPNSRMRRTSEEKDK